METSIAYCLWRPPARGGDGAILEFHPTATATTEKHGWVELRNHGNSLVRVWGGGGEDEWLQTGDATLLRLPVARTVWDNLVRAGWEPLSPNTPRKWFIKDLPPSRDWMGDC
jgi:hypothetical protein